MTLKLDNSIPKDPYTKQLWAGYDRISMQKYERYTELEFMHELY